MSFPRIPSVQFGDKKIPERFWKKVRLTDGCWVWTGPVNRRGYGRHWLGPPHPKSKRAAAHRFMAQRLVGDLPKTVFVCHHCDNPSCVRPEHLFTGTARDNVLDMIRKGRRANHNTYKTHCKRGHPLEPRPGCKTRYCHTCQLMHQRHYRERIKIERALRASGSALLLALARRVLRTNGSSVEGRAVRMLRGAGVEGNGPAVIRLTMKLGMLLMPVRVRSAVGSLLTLALGCTAPQPTVTLEDGCQVRIPSMVCPERDRCLAVIEFEGCGDGREGR